MSTATTLTTNKHSRNGNGDGVLKNIIAESGNFGIAEMVSMGTSLGIVYLADVVTPGLVKASGEMLSKTLIEPNLEVIEKNLKRFCKLEECQPDENKSRKERAENIAKTTIVFSAAWAGSMAAKILTRNILNKKLKIPEASHTGKEGWFSKHILDKEGFRIMLADEGLHYGSLLMLNTCSAQYTDDMIHSTSKWLQKLGMSKGKADEMSAMAIIWELPNVLGMVGGTAAITYNHLTRKGAAAVSHVERLTHQTALAGTLNVPAV